MKPGRELDALVGEKVMGYLAMGLTDPIESRYKYPDDVWPHIPEYSTDIEAAWNVLKELRKEGKKVQILPDETVQVFKNHPADHDALSARGDSVEHAICLAALKAAGGEI